MRSSTASLFSPREIRIGMNHTNPYRPKTPVSAGKSRSPAALRPKSVSEISAKFSHCMNFAGFNSTLVPCAIVEEASAVLGLSRPVAYRNWKYARAWLREALEK